MWKPSSPSAPLLLQYLYFKSLCRDFQELPNNFIERSPIPRIQPLFVTGTRGLTTDWRFGLIWVRRGLDLLLTLLLSSA